MVISQGMKRTTLNTLSAITAKKQKSLQFPSKIKFHEQRRTERAAQCIGFYFFNQGMFQQMQSYFDFFKCGSRKKETFFIILFSSSQSLLHGRHYYRSWHLRGSEQAVGE